MKWYEITPHKVKAGLLLLTFWAVITLGLGVLSGSVTLTVNLNLSKTEEATKQTAPGGPKECRDCHKESPSNTEGKPGTRENLCTTTYFKGGKNNGS